jgi:hypothetical protein
LHLIKRAAEKRTTRSWDLSIKNAVNEIQRTNRRRKAGGKYIADSELFETFSEIYALALDWAATEAFGGHYESDDLGAMVDREAIINQAIALVSGGDG